MSIVTSSYRPKRAPGKKRKQPATVSAIVTPPKLKPLKGPVIRLSEQQAADNGAIDQLPGRRRSAIVEPKWTRSTIFGPAPDNDPEEHPRLGDAADTLWR